MMTEPGKFAPGLTGFPTPNTPADEDAYLLFLFPDKTWAQYILGACRALVVEYNWYLSGDLETWEASEALRLIIQEAPYNLVDRSVPAPYWDEDSADDADDTAPQDDQPWYGILIDDNLTWVENVGFWAITAFVALAATPAAAIAFVPIARRFTVAVKKHDLGGIVKAFIDGSEVGSIDTYSPSDGVGEMTIIMPEPGGAFRAEDTPHTLWVSMSDEVNPAVVGVPNIQVLRKRLTETDVTPANLRYNADCDCVQMTPDGGTTWNDAPGSDPRHAPGFRLPPRTGTDRRCDAAANQVKWLRDFIESVTTLLEAAGLAFQVANLLLDFIDLLFPGGVLVELLINIGAELFTIGGAALDAAFTETEWELLLCIFFCGDDLDGQVNADLFSSITSQVTAQLNTTAALVTNLVLSSQGEVGLSNAGTLGSETADCSSCGCTWCYNFHAGNRFSDWIPHVFGSNPLATYDGVKWTGFGSVWISWTFDDPVTITDAAVLEYFLPTGNCVIYINGSGGVFDGTQIWANGAVVGTPFPVDVTRFDVSAIHAFGSDEITISEIQISGDDPDNPIGDSNC